MNIKILSDSTCDLSAAQLKEHNIDLAHLTIVKDGVAYQDGVTITPADIFAHVAAGGDLCSTTAYNIGEYEALFAKYAAEYDGIIHISLGSGFSSSYQNACIAADMLGGVYPVDSCNLCGGTGLLAIEAAQMIAQGMDAKQVQEVCMRLRSRIHGCFILDTLEFLAAGGRCSSVLAIGANLLQLKPCIEVENTSGSMHTGKKYRGNYTKCVQNYIRDTLTRCGDIDTERLILASTGTSPELMEECRKTIKSTLAFKELIEVDASCTISSHCGPGTVGLFYKTSV